MSTKHLVALVATFTMLVACGADRGPVSDGSGLRTNTWSIVAVDSESGEVGIALATCLAADVSISRQDAAGVSPPHSYRIVGAVGGELAFELARIVPGVGAMIAQARVDAGNTGRLDSALAELVEGGTPAEAVGAAIEVDAMPQRRQYAIAAFEREAATFTGSETSEWSGGVSHQAVAVQGNILVGAQVVEKAMAAFQAVMADPGAGLADALLAGMEAGAAEGGDRRCPREQAALVAFMAVAHRDDTAEAPRLWLATEPQAIGGDNPVALLRQAYDRARSAAADGDDGSRVVALWALGLVASLAVGAGLWTAFRRRRVL